PESTPNDVLLERPQLHQIASTHTLRHDAVLLDELDTTSSTTRRQRRQIERISVNIALRASSHTSSSIVETETNSNLDLPRGRSSTPSWCNPPFASRRRRARSDLARVILRSISFSTSAVAGIEASFPLWYRQRMRQLSGSYVHSGRSCTRTM